MVTRTRGIGSVKTKEGKEGRDDIHSKTDKANPNRYYSHPSPQEAAHALSPQTPARYPQRASRTQVHHQQPRCAGAVRGS